MTLTWQTSVYITTTGNTFEKRSFLALVGISLGIGEIAGGYVILQGVYPYQSLHPCGDCYLPGTLKTFKLIPFHFLFCSVSSTQPLFLTSYYYMFTLLDYTDYRYICKVILSSGLAGVE